MQSELGTEFQRPVNRTESPQDELCRATPKDLEIKKIPFLLFLGFRKGLGSKLVKGGGAEGGGGLRLTWTLGQLALSGQHR